MVKTDCIVYALLSVTEGTWKYKSGGVVHCKSPAFFLKLKSDYNKTLVKNAVGVPSYVHEVKGHVEVFLQELPSYWSSGIFFQYLGVKRFLHL